ncbi:hypothetical protein LCGC14_0209430 [marine sediment metagenome]|uniref:Uncharacterized protein n=1 Tax=marine sediment metagenome TaxID=412755 RepID=A0A0F9UY66_9ZZZZ
MVRPSGHRENMSDQVVRYETEEEYIEYTNHRRWLATGTLVSFPDWAKDPDAYWNAHAAYIQKHPTAVLEMWTLLHKEHIDPGTGELLSQDCSYTTLAYENLEIGKVSRQLVRDNELSDPGTPVSIEFSDIKEAQKMRAFLMQGTPGYYYDIKHRVGVAIIDRETKNAE